MGGPANRFATTNTRLLVLGTVRALRPNTNLPVGTKAEVSGIVLVLPEETNLASLVLGFHRQKLQQVFHVIH